MFEQVANQALGGGDIVGEGHEVFPIFHEIPRQQFEQNWWWLTQVGWSYQWESTSRKTFAVISHMLWQN